MCGRSNSAPGSTCGVFPLFTDFAVFFFFCVSGLGVGKRVGRFVESWFEEVARFGGLAFACQDSLYKQPAKQLAGFPAAGQVRREVNAGEPRLKLAMYRSRGSVEQTRPLTPWVKSDSAVTCAELERVKTSWGLPRPIANWFSSFGLLLDSQVFTLAVLVWLFAFSCLLCLGFIGTMLLLAACV